MIERKGQKLGSVLVDREVEPSTEPEPEVETREDGVHSVGGGWYELVIDGDVIDKIRGTDAAREAYEAYQEVNDGDDRLP